MLWSVEERVREMKKKKTIAIPPFPSLLPEDDDPNLLLLFF